MSSNSRNTRDLSRTENRDDGGLPRSAPIDISGRGRNRGATFPAGNNDGAQGLFRDECFGLPQKGHMFPPHLEDKFKEKSNDDFHRKYEQNKREQEHGRRSTTSDHANAYQKVQEAMMQFEGRHYLLVSPASIRSLSPLWTGIQPIANLKMFERILINKEINQVHTDHAVAALEKIGKNCKHLVVISPIHTSEYGELFKRESGNMGTLANDWRVLFKCFPELVAVTFKHPENEPGDLMLETFKNFQSAIVGAQYSAALKINVSGPPELVNAH